MESCAGTHTKYQWNSSGAASALLSTEMRSVPHGAFCEMKTNDSNINLVIYSRRVSRNTDIWPCRCHASSAALPIVDAE